MNQQLRMTLSMIAGAAAAGALALALPVSLPVALAVGIVGSLCVPLHCLWRQSAEEAARRADALERRLADTQAYVQRLLDAIPEPIYIKDAQARFLMVNSAFLQERERPSEDVVGLTSFDLAPNEAMQRTVAEEDAQILRHGAEVFKEQHTRTPITGEERFRHVHKRLCHDIDGQPIIVGAHFDITALRQAERALQHTLEREKTQRERTQVFIQRLIDVIPDPVYVKDANSRYLLVNAAFARERGLPQARMVGMSSLDLAPDAATRDLVASEDRGILLTGSEVYKEQHTTHPVSGAEVYRVVTKRLSRDVDDRPVIVGAHFDLTKWKIAERDLKEALAREKAQRERVQNYMQRLIDVIPQPVYVKNSDSRYLLINEAFCRDRMLPRETLLAATPFDLARSAEHARRVIQEDQDVLAGRVILKEESIPHPATQEERFRIISKGSCLDADGLPVIVGANFDVTEWRRAERRLQHAKNAAEQASAAKSLFLASMSHEIRTPLSGVIGTLRIALRDAGLQADTRDYLELSLRNAESLLGIINDILDFSKIEAGQLTLEHIDFDLERTARDSLQAFREHAESRDLRFNLDIDPALPRYVRGDPTRVRQILINLVGNAVKFTERGAITVGIRHLHSGEGRHHLAFSVADTGVGIPQESLPNLFQKFQQADVSTTRRYGGTGLGLAICRQLVEAMGGNITVRSTPGTGSIFEFDLFLDAGTAPLHDDHTPLPPHSHRLRVLYAEDVAVNQLIVKSQLVSLGHAVDIAATGLEAVRALARQDYDLVLMDGRMPEMDGVDATRVIRAGGLADLRVRDPQIYVVALTANASSEDRARYLGAGMDDFLTKPVNERQLHAVIEAAIAQRIARGAAFALEQTETPAPQVHAQTIVMPRRETASHVVDVFLGTLPQCIDDMDYAMSHGRVEALATLLRTLSGSAAAVGLEELQMLAGDLAEAAREGRLSVLQAHYPHLRAALTTLHTCIA